MTRETLPARRMPSRGKLWTSKLFFALCAAVSVGNLWYGLAQGWVYIGVWQAHAQSPALYWFGIGKWSLILLGSLGFIALGCHRLLRSPGSSGS